MKTRINKLLLLRALIVGLGLILTGRVTAQTSTSFPIATNSAVVQLGWNIAYCGTDYLVSYVSGTNKVVQLISTNGALLGSPVVVGTNVSFAASGELTFGSANYLAVWSDNSIGSGVDMFGQFVSQSGAKVGASFKLLSTSDYNNNGYGYQTVEAFATDGTNFLVGWQDGNSGNFFGQLVTPSGTLSGQEFLISSGNSGNPNTGGGDSIAIVFGKTNYLAVWQSQDGGSDYQTYGELISRTGVARSPFQINQTASVDGFNPINVAFDGTNYLAAWNWDAGSVSGAPEDWEIFGRLVSQTGTFPGNELQLVTDPGSQVLPELAYDGANYLMAWGAGSFNAQAANPTVRFQFFNRFGSPISSQFTVFNAQGTNSPLLAGLVFDGTRFVAVATWGTISTDASGSVDGFPSAEVFGAFIPVTVPFGVITTSLPNGTNGVAYDRSLVVSGGQTPYSWTNSSGALPPGLTLATNGVISGTPTTNGMFNFTVKVTDALSSTATQALVLTVIGPLPIVTIQPTNNSVTVTVGNNVTLTAAVTGTGPFSYQWQLNKTNLPDGIITTVAGNGIEGNSGDGGPATNAEFYYPEFVVVDATGNLFISDYGNYRIRKVGTNGIITTVAGNGTNGYSGDAGAATNAELSLTFGVAVDATGNLFIADWGNNVVRKVGTNGIITTVAGNGTNGYSGDGGAATNAELWAPVGVAVDATGNLFITDPANHVIREVGTNGIISTVAGNGTNGYYGDGGAATNAELSEPFGVAVDTTGNLFITDPANNVIREVGTNGIISIVAGKFAYGYGYSGDGGAATNAELWGPAGVAVDATGDLFIADGGNNVIRKVGTNGIINTVAGNGYGAGTGNNGGYSGDGGAATNAELWGPVGVAVDATGNLFIMDSGNLRVRKVVFPGPTLVLNNVGFGNAGAYDVVVSGAYGSVTSSVVNLTITIPVILSAPQITVGKTNFAFQLSGPAGSNYVLQVSTDLLNWSSVSTSTIPTSGTLNLTNAISGYNRRFYRALIP